jgi:2-C-methyl-D-erythritol 4-phosphate cytidylyltransferase
MKIQSARYYCVVVAAGRGQRLGDDCPKQYLPIAGRTILEWSLGPFLEMPIIERVVVVISKDDHRFSSLPISNHPKLNCVMGGAERYHSVLSGLRDLAQTAEPSDWVLVHDAARPKIGKEDLNRLISTVANHPVGGLLGAPVSDSLKVIGQNQQIIEDAPREKLWRAFTPQMFRLGLLQTALEEALDSNLCITDEASAISRMGLEAIMIEGRSDNFKITSLSDYQMMEILMSSSSSIDLPVAEGVEN